LAKEGNKRVTGKEQYYTPSSLANDLVAKTIVELAGKLDINSYKATWVEPAGGTGNFIFAAQMAGITNIKSWDIEPKSAGIVKGNFLEQDLSKLARPLIVYGNPPFGRNNSLAVKFFNHASEHADVIAFLVPRSWRKWSVHNKLDKRFELVSDIDVDEDRGYIKKVGFEDADVSMTVFGHGCGKVKREFPRVSNSTQMFLQADEYVIKALEKIDFSEFYERTAYVEALSIKEIMYCLNRHFDT
jgi:predicted RNA methylase